MGKLAEIPILEFSNWEENWKELCKKVREACEQKGCFLLKYDRIGRNLREKMFAGMKESFELPIETKKKYTSPKSSRGYFSNAPHIPLHESFGVTDATKLELAQSFTNLMWPHQGNASFCETLHVMSSKMLELNILILKMIHESFGVKYNDKNDTTSLLRMLKYGGAPPDYMSSGAESIGILAHTDTNTLTILCQNDVQGFELQSKDGQWERVVVPEDAFIVLVGDTLKTWSNGRLHALLHRVVIDGEKERYTFGMFSMPKDEVLVEVPDELVDQDHPLLYRPFKYSDVRPIVIR